MIKLMLGLAIAGAIFAMFGSAASAAVQGVQHAMIHSTAIIALR